MFFLLTYNQIGCIMDVETTKMVVQEHKGVIHLKINKTKLELILARQCKTISSLRCGTSPKTLQKIREGKEIRPIAVGRLAKALGVDPLEILEKEE